MNSTTISSSTATVAARASPLRLLRKETTLSPRNQTQHAKVLTALSRIASVRVSGSIKRDGHRCYTIDIQFATTAQLRLSKPNHAKCAVPSQSQASTVSVTSVGAGSKSIQIQRRFTEFSNLRHEMLYHANASHRYGTRGCEFCTTVVGLLTSVPALPRLHMLLLSSAETIQQQLDAFLSLTLELATMTKSHNHDQHHHHRGRRCCEGQEMVPLLVKQFLLGADGEIDASVATHTPSEVSPWAFS